MTVDVATLAIRINSLEARNAARDMDRMRDSGGRAERQVSSLETATRKLTDALALIGIGAGIGAIIRMADEYTKFTAQLRLATTSTREYAVALDDVRRIANTSQQDLASTGVLYARIANGTRELGVGQKQVASITEVVNLALKVSGATASESASAMLQLSQAFASGTLRGEEFNAVNEAAPRLMKALADGMGLPVGALKKMAEEGAITSKIMATVLPQALQDLKEEAKQVQTISGSFTVLKNKVMELTAVKAEANGMVRLLIGSLSILADNLDVVMAAMSGLFAIKIAGYFIAGAAAVNAYFAANAELAALVVAEKAALVARAEAMVASTAATAASTAAKLVESEAVLAGLVARRSEIIAIREGVVAQLAQARSAIASAEAAIAAASAAGAQSYALRILRLSTAELVVAEAARAAAMAELAALGVAQARVSAQITAATAAQTAASAANAAATTAQAAAQAGLAGAAGRTATSVGVLTTALRFLGGPVGIITGLLGIGVTAWLLWGNKAKESAEQAAESFDEAQARIVKGLDEQITKNERLIQLQNLGAPKTKAERDLPIVEQLAKASKLLNDINNRAGDFAPGKGKSNDDVLLARVKTMRDIADLTEKMQKRDTTGDLAADGTRQAQMKKWYGENGTAAQRLAAELEKLKKQFGEIPPEMEKLVRAKFVDKDMVSSSKAQLESRLEGIKSSIERERNMRAEGVAAITELQRQGLASDYAVYDAKRVAAVKAGEDSVKVFDAEIAALSAYHGKDAAERTANDAKIKKLGADRTEALRSSLVAAEQLRVAYEYDRDKPARDAEAANVKEIVAINDQIAAIELQIASYNKLPSAITAATIAQLEAEKATVSLFEGSENAVVAIDAKIAAYTRLAGVQKVAQVMDTSNDVAKAKELLDILVAVDNAAKSAAQGMAASFGAVGTAIGGLTTALTDYAVQQQAVAAQLAAVKADPKSSADKIAKAEMAASKASAQAQIKSYGDMANASKGFFKENSKGYKALEATERAFRAFEMAMAIESMVRKVFAIGAVTTATVTGEGVKTAAVAAGTAAQVAADTVKGTSAAAVAVATQAQGDPYSAWARMAAMVAAMAALGFAVAGGGGSDKSLSQQRQEAQGTGTVFGDSTAKSDSIKRSLELVAGNSNIELSYTQGMLAALRNIESSLSGLGNVLVRNSGLTSSTVAGTGSGAQDAFMFMQPFWSIGAKSVGNLVGKIFGGKTTVEDTGFKIDPTTLGAGMAGNLNSFQYTDIKKSGGWFSSDDWDTKWNALGGAADAQFAAVLKGLGGSVAEAAKLLGLGGDAFTQRLNGFVIDIGKISLKGMDAEEIQKTLEAVFSKLGDDLASYAVAGLDMFSQIGEGPLETLTRIAANYANLDSILASSSTSFGQVGMSSIAARERLIALAGGIDELASAQASFNDNFLTEAERLAPVQKYVTDQLAAMGLQSVDTRDKFKDVVLGLANSGALATEAGAAQYTALLALADAFAKTHAATEDLTKSEQEIADERKDLAQQLDEITKSDEERLAIQLAGIADVNKALFNQVQAAKAVVSAKDALSSAYDRESSAAKTALDRSKAWVTTLNGLNANLALSNQSTLTPEQKYAEARAQFEKTLAAANAGDTTAQSGLSAAEQAFLTASQVVNASDAKYAADYARVIAANQEAVKWATVQVDVQQASLDALTAQVSSLITINDSVLTVAQAIANLQTAMGVTDSMGVKFTNAPAVTAMAVAAAPAIDFSRYQAGSNAGSDALAAEVKALRAEVAGLRADQAKQTGAMIQSNEQANAKAADKVVSGVEKSAQASAWSSTVKGEYA